MRGSNTVCGALFSYVDLQKRVRPSHPLRLIRGIANNALTSLSAAFDRLCAQDGRESIPPERRLRVFLLQASYSIRFERHLVERTEFDLLFRWFVGRGVDDLVWDTTTFPKNRDRLLAGEVAVRFSAIIVTPSRVRRPLSSEHFSVDGTLIEAWSSPNSFQLKDGSGSPPGPGRNGERDFQGERRSDDTHASTTDPHTRLYREARSKEAKSSSMGHTLMENRNRMTVSAVATHVLGHTECLAALHLLAPMPIRRAGSH